MNRKLWSIWVVGLAVAALPLSSGCKRPQAEAPARVAEVPLSQIGLTDDGWFQVYDQAVAKARETGKPLLVDFTGSDWCGWCIKLDEEVFAHDEFKKWAEENVVLLKLDYPRSVRQPSSLMQQNDELRFKYQIQGYPTILFLDADGTTLGKAGYKPGGPAAWTSLAEEQLKKM
ncbi:MAG TPA: thioredoxin family protein [Pirellulaceae bacterium]|nr:thioredoxin family protein [Pirellulaceae bacterium]